MKICSRNVNGIRAVLGKGFLDRVKQEQADIICLQEVKAFETQIPPEVRFFLTDYQYLWHRGTRPGYAGTAIFYRKNLEIIEKRSDFPIASFHEDGRVTELRFLYQEKEIVLLNFYVPNGNIRADGTEML
ncbi:MAG: endonuclease/exonuclease/phosphatase family protein [Candidatus Peribacteria bacterium]|jgi:exodeoxyribonuclease-3|nr:endonuclease/exonuclease/phosphatase family protein [Candidatus Peribacteria bacterium]